MSISIFSLEQIYHFKSFLFCEADRLRGAAFACRVVITDAVFRRVFDELCECDADVQEALRFCRGEEKDANHLAMDLLDDCLIALADGLGCSVDYLLGRTTEVRTAEPEKRKLQAAPIGWQQGTPKRKGWYAVKLQLRKVGAVEQPRVFWWGDNGWSLAGGAATIDSSYTVTKWLPLPKED